MSNEEVRWVEFADLIGDHVLYGVEFGSIKCKGSYRGFDEEANYILFNLDGITYQAIENPDDGYRSMLSGIRIVDQEVKPFAGGKKEGYPVEVRYDESDHEILDFYLKPTQPVQDSVLCIGTDNSCAYYPTCIMYFNAELLGEVND